MGYLIQSRPTDHAVPFGRSSRESRPAESIGTLRVPRYEKSIGGTMLITIDDATGPMSVFLNVSLGCLCGLGFLGYVALWLWIKERANRANWSKWLTGLLTGLVFILGLAAIVLAPASLLHRLK